MAEEFTYQNYSEERARETGTGYEPGLVEHLEGSSLAKAQANSIKWLETQEIYHADSSQASPTLQP
ncbi:MAG: hypothetical protein Q9M91_07765 [Candidatus Dojkabacteria bacterium]|nr:hypothetical protein [Candidatus Dojkabacteria bacterium]MDQ7021683.1 hypothetical protein [Candidatus Dojkabacteria bacterium]